jgi:hypothetical protein
MSSFLLIPEGDLASLPNLSSLVGIAVIAGTGSTIMSNDGSTAWSVHEVALRCLGAVAASRAGFEATRRYLAEIVETSGMAAPPICDLTNVKADAREAALLRFVVERLGAISERNLRRVADLSRSLVALRQVHEQMQCSFAKLEKFVLDNNLAQRTQCLALLPGRDMPPLILAEGQVLTQRLPVSSVGLSDVTIFIDEMDSPADAKLSVALLTREDNALRAHWSLTGPQLAKGPLRLAMRTALQTLPLTPYLEVTWLGLGQIQLSSSIYHPDPRHQPDIDGAKLPQVLAMQCWSYLPGLEAPLPVGAHLPIAGEARPPRLRVINADVLATVEDLTPESKHSCYLADQKAVLVHPMPQGTSIMRVASCIPAGTTTVVARICTIAEQASVIEYAFAIAPSGRNLTTPPFDPTSASATRTPWVALRPKEVGELHLPLAEALESDNDLFLMTRLATQPGDASWGWATFDRIRIFLGEAR